MVWMSPFFSQGQLAGKLLCPNKRCQAKLGNYDWAGQVSVLLKVELNIMGLVLTDETSCVSILNAALWM